MFDETSARLRFATRMTGVSRLMEATAVIQRTLMARSTPASSARPAGHGPAAMTIDGVAEHVGEADIRTAADRADTEEKAEAGPAAHGSSIPGRIDLRDLVRGRQTARPSASPQPQVLPPGAQWLSDSYACSAGTRPYRLYVPSTCQPGQSAALVVMLHGCTQSPEDFAAGTSMNEAAEQGAFLVAYPGQTRQANMQSCWNWFSRSDQERAGGEPSIIAGITRRIAADYSVDPRRIYIAGLSAGGAMAAIMGCAYPDLYAAIGVHSGLASGSAHDLPSALAAMRSGSPGAHGRRPIPAIVFHGLEDSTVNPSNAAAVLRQATQGLELRSRTETGEVQGGHGYTRILGMDAAGRTLAESWSVQGAGHAWSGGSKAGSYTDPQGPDATAEMVRFFLEHPMQPGD